jgi:seryl-tRNA(Sec) selenium transferase
MNQSSQEALPMELMSFPLAATNCSGNAGWVDCRSPRNHRAAFGKHSLYRALRVDKLTLAALQATLTAHRRGTCLKKYPALRMLAMTKAEVAERAESSSPKSPLNTTDLIVSLVEGESAVGGGSGPNTHPPLS